MDRIKKFYEDLHRSTNMENAKKAKRFIKKINDEKSREGMKKKLDVWECARSKEADLWKGTIF